MVSHADGITSYKAKGPVPSTTTKRSYYGATYLFDHIDEQLGIIADLKA